MNGDHSHYLIPSFHTHWKCTVSTPQAPDTNIPVITAFSIPASSDSLTVPITLFTASDNVAVTGYLLTETQTPPSASNPNWTVSAPSSYTFSSTGSKTLSAWAKDAAGNISSALSGTVTVVLLDSTPPSISFTAPTSSATLTGNSITISATASDNASVSNVRFWIGGTLLGTDASSPYSTLLNSTLFTNGTYTLSAVATDASGNAATTTESVTISNTDLSAPSITSFTLPGTNASLTVPITSFTATDNVGVSGYLISENSTPPTAEGWNWLGSAPSSYTFSSQGSHTLYAWVRDAAGNVSNTASASVLIPDTIAPTISSVASSTSQTSVTITWTTDEATTSTIQYGTSVAYGSSSSSSISTSTHAMVLTGLTANTLYHFRIRAWDATGNASTTGDYAVRTGAAPDMTPPVISSVSSSTSQTTATIAWTTDEASTSTVQYGTTVSYGSSSSSSALVTSHAIVITGLSANTLYHFRVRSQDGSGNVGTSSDYSMRTPAAPDTTAPAISMTAPAEGAMISGNSVTVSASASDDVSVSNVRFWINSTILATDTSSPYSTILNSTSYANGTYTLTAVATDSSGNAATTTRSVTISNGGTSPVISDVSASSFVSTSAEISWLTDVAATSTIEYGLTSSYGSALTVNTATTTHVLTAHGLVPETAYHYRVRSQDALGRVSSSPDATVTTISPVPELPRAYMDTAYVEPTGTVRYVNAGDNLQTAFDAAQPGDTIVLQAGAAFAGQFTLRNKAGNGWIYIRSSDMANLPSEGNRVSPADASHMPAIVATNGTGAIVTESQAHQYRFAGIEIRAVNGLYNYQLVQIGNGETSTDALPHDIVFDRCYVHGDLAGGTRRGILGNGNSIALIDSYITDINEPGRDSQTFIAWNAAGPFKIVNNYLVAATENLFFGGADSASAALNPADIEIRGNYLPKPASLQGLYVKNNLEFKNAQRVLIEGNVFEDNWVGADQAGYGIVFSPRNQDGHAPWSVVQDITFRKNIATGILQGVNILGRDRTWSESPSEQARRILIQDNVISVDGDGGRLFQVLEEVADLAINHNTGIAPANGSAVFSAANSSARPEALVLTNNLLTGVYGFWGNYDGTSLTQGSITWDAMYLGRRFERNALAYAAGTYPANNYFPADTNAFGFVSAAGGDYHLAPSSAYRNAGIDGRDLGADIDAVAEATVCAVSGQCGAPAAPDTAAPAISSVASSTSATTATIAWITNEASTSTVQHGLTASYGSSASDSARVFSHSVTISNLSPNTLYHFRVSSQDGSGNVAVSGDYAFRTTAGSGVFIDAVSVSSFAGLTDAEIANAAAVTMMHRHASVGGNISDGLNTLQSGDTKYNRTNFNFQNRGNPGWSQKLTDFSTQVAAQIDDFNVFSMKFCYIDSAASANSYISTMTGLEAANPSKTFIWWTMPTHVSDNIAAIHTFNETIRAYAAANGKILFDLASIESHQFDGAPCTSGGTENLCAGYTADGGHLNATGQQRAAQAFWVLMSEVAEQLSGASSGGVDGAIANPSFESPAVASFQYNPSGGSWTFYGNSGVQHNGSGWEAPSAPDGVQTAYLQGNPNQVSADGTGVLGAIYQTVSLPAGTYTLTMSLSQRYGDLQPLRVRVDGTQVGNLLSPASEIFTEFTTSAFTVSEGSHVIRIEATDNTADRTTFLDWVRIGGA